MTLIALFAATLLSGLLIGYCINLPAGFGYLFVPVCAFGALAVFRLLSTSPRISIQVGATAGVLSGILGAIFGTLISAFSGSVALGIVNAADDFERIFKEVQVHFWRNLLLCSILGLAGGLLGVALFRKLVIPSLALSPKRRLALNIGMLVLALIACLIFPLQAQRRALSSIQMVHEYPLYVMHYSGNYGFSGLMRSGLEIASANTEISGKACTAIAASNAEGQPIFGKNEDWSGRPTLLLFTEPADGYRSISLVDLTILGFYNQELAWPERIFILQAPYIPFDGLNEYGLTIGSMTDYGEAAGLDPEKPTLGSLHLIRLILDHARDVNEAIDLISQYNINMRYGGAPPLHYLIADAAGESAVIEFVEGEMVVTRNAVPWQVATNFTIAGKTVDEAKSWCWRYKKASELLDGAGGQLSQAEMMQVLQGVSQDNTRWSATFNLLTGDIQLVLGRQYEDVLSFALEMNAPH